MVKQPEGEGSTKASGKEGKSNKGTKVIFFCSAFDGFNSVFLYLFVFLSTELEN